MRFEYHPEAAGELTSSIEYYEEKSQGLGIDFLDELEDAIAQALAHPKSGSLITDQVRRILLARFPYEVIYEVTDNIVLIIAVKHLSRRPGYWKTRK